MTCLKTQETALFKMGLFSLRIHTADVMCVFCVCLQLLLPASLASVFVYGCVYFVQLCICFGVFWCMSIDKFCESLYVPVLISS